MRDRNSVMTISLGRSAANASDVDRDSLDLAWRGMSPFVGRNVEWRIRDRKPFAAMIRSFTIAHDESPRADPGRQGDARREVARIDALRGKMMPACLT